MSPAIRFGRIAWDLTVVSSSLLKNSLNRNFSGCCRKLPGNRFREFEGGKSCRLLKMGSINCKEYKTQKNPANAQQSGDTGSYKFRSESDMEDFVEKVVCNETDINDNEMKQLDMDENTKILLVKQNSKLTAIGTKCTHYGAPLNTGVLGEGWVRCPWHGACFNVETGDIEDFPGLDSLPCYQVSVDNGQVKVRARKTDLEKNKRLQNMVKRSEDDKRTFVVIGGGPSAGVCVETLRQEGYSGRIVMICKEKALPYDRVKLSKATGLSLDAIQFRNLDFYKENSIETLLGVEATKVDTTAKTVTCSDGSTVNYDLLYVATGSQARKAPLPGADLQNVYTIRDYEDATAINSAVSDKLNVVCLGASFIAMEAASTLVKKVASVTVIGRDDVPFKQAFGEKCGERIMKLFTENNIKMMMKSGVKEIIGKDGKVSEVELLDGTKLPCDLFIMGTGGKLCTDFLKGSGVKLNDDGSIDTDANLRTNIPEVYAGGDIANAPVLANQNNKATIGHYQLAQYHGRIAAMNMAGKSKELRAVPFFWTMFFGKGVRYSGYGKGTSEKIIGSLDDLKFVLFNFDNDGYAVSACSVGHDPVVAQFAEYVSQGNRLHKNDVEASDPFAWSKNLSRPSKVC